MPTYDKDGHLFGDAYFNADYFHVGNEASEKTYINMENEELEIHNLVAPTEDNDAATKKYVDDTAGGGGGVSNVVSLSGDETQAELNAFCAAVFTMLNAGVVPELDYAGGGIYHFGDADEMLGAIIFNKFSTGTTMTCVTLEFTKAFGGTDWSMQENTYSWSATQE